uniref:Uncharacterized protein n=1 Tax=Avena sativa TaxID=4498 RepID=A0ACD5V495_AVESA
MLKAGATTLTSCPDVTNGTDANAHAAKKAKAESPGALDAAGGTHVTAVAARAEPPLPLGPIRPRGCQPRVPEHVRPYGGSTTQAARELAAAACLDGEKITTEKKRAPSFFCAPSVAAPFASKEPAPESKGSDWMAHAAAAARSRCVVAVLAVAVFLACLPPAASSSSRRAAAALQRVQMAAMYTPQDLQEKPDLTKDAEEDVSTTGLGEEEEREVPTGPDPIHHHGRGPRRQQSP